MRNSGYRGNTQNATSCELDFFILGSTSRSSSLVNLTNIKPNSFLLDNEIANKRRLAELPNLDPSDFIHDKFNIKRHNGLGKYNKKFHISVYIYKHVRYTESSLFSLLSHTIKKTSPSFDRKFVISLHMTIKTHSIDNDNDTDARYMERRLGNQELDLRIRYNL